MYSFLILYRGVGDTWLWLLSLEYKQDIGN
jgi:hypothetical protein